MLIPNQTLLQISNQTSNQMANPIEDAIDEFFHIEASDDLIDTKIYPSIGLISTMKSIFGNITPSPLKSKILSHKTINQIKPHTRSKLLEFDQFHFDLFSEKALIEPYPIYRILEGLIFTKSFGVIEHFSSNLILDGEIKTIINILKVILGSVGNSGFILKSLSENHSEIRTFIRQGLNEDLMQEIFTWYKEEELITLIEIGFMRDRIDVKMIKNIICHFQEKNVINISLSSVGFILINLAPDLSSQIIRELFSSDDMTHHIIPFVNTSGSREIIQILGLESVRTRLSSHSVVIQSLAREIIKIIENRDDMDLEDKCQIYRTLIKSYPAEMVNILNGKYDL